VIKRLGLVWGGLFLLGGALGFVPGITNGDMFLGVFMVNTTHGLLHIGSGAIFLIASALGSGATRLWFQIFGLFYAALAVIGFRLGDEMIFGIISNNRYDSWGHALLALILLLIGFVRLDRGRAAPDKR